MSQRVVGEQESISRMLFRHLVGATLCLVVFASWVLFYSPSPHPSDSVLIKRFQEHRADFDRLAAMANADPNIYSMGRGYLMFVHSNKLWPDDGEELFSRRRWNQYQALFDRLGSAAPNHFHRDSGLILIPVSIAETSQDEDLQSLRIEKGYVYSSGSLSTVESLDGFGFDTHARFYKEIDEHWYLYHDWAVSKPE